VPTYSVFGLRLRSDIELPEAGPVTNEELTLGIGREHPADCVVERRCDRAPDLPQRLLGEETVYGDLKVRCYQTESGYRLIYDDTGTFDVSATGVQVTWWSDEAAPMDAVQTDVLGRVIALALHSRGILTLHASAVSIAGQGVVFLAPKSFGKSSLAVALLHAGARLVSDDTVAVEPGTPPLLRAGVQTLRLRPDAAVRHLVPLDGTSGGKVRFRPDTAHSVGVEKTPLSALYLLQPAAPSSAAPLVARQRCAATAATLALTAFRKLGALLDGRTGAASFTAAADLVGMVPVYSLHVQRILERIDEVGAELVRWHSSAPVPAALLP
jgi:hypothetical protein